MFSSTLKSIPYTMVKGEEIWGRRTGKMCKDGIALMDDSSFPNSIFSKLGRDLRPQYPEMISGNLSCVSAE